MEHFKLKLSYFSLHTLKSVASRPDLMWRTILVCMVLCAVAISVARFVSSVWIAHSAPAVMPTTSKRITVTPQDISKTLDVYQEKQARFNLLLEEVPQVPSLSRGSGVVVEEGSIPEEVILEDSLGESVLDGPQP
jgi:hypothetical protein